jgi:hypothetical protein
MTSAPCAPRIVMEPIQSFGAAAATWQNFYLLVGGAAATLTGLMFVAVTFGSSLVTPETSASARSFLDPVIGHFTQVLTTACFLLVPTMDPRVLGALLLAVAAVRALTLIRIIRHMVQASRRHADLDLSDWLSGAVVPMVVYLLLGATGVGFMARFAIAFTGLVVATVVTLLNGVFCAWELMVWMAITRARVEKPAASEPDET